jgi:hypothetical protein
MNSKGTIVDNYVDNEKIFRFPYFSTSDEYKKIKLLEEKAKIAAIKAKDPALYNIAIGRGTLADQTAFNNMFDTVLNVNRYQRDLKQKKKLLGLHFKPIDYDKYTVGQLKQGLYVDFFDMCNELLLMESFNTSNLNNILSKNYRKIILLFIFLITILIAYIIIYILDQK